MFKILVTEEKKRTSNHGNWMIGTNPFPYQRTIALLLVAQIQWSTGMEKDAILLSNNMTHLCKLVLLTSVLLHQILKLKSKEEMIAESSVTHYIGINSKNIDIFSSVTKENSVPGY